MNPVMGEVLEVINQGVSFANDVIVAPDGTLHWTCWPWAPSSGDCLVGSLNKYINLFCTCLPMVLLSVMMVYTFTFHVVENLHQRRQSLESLFGSRLDRVRNVDQVGIESNVDQGLGRKNIGLRKWDY